MCLSSMRAWLLLPLPPAAKPNRHTFTTQPMPEHTMGTPPLILAPLACCFFAPAPAPDAEGLPDSPWFEDKPIS